MSPTGKGGTFPLTLTLSPRRGDKEWTSLERRKRLSRIQREDSAKNGVRFSLSLGERAGVRASVLTLHLA